MYCTFNVACLVTSVTLLVSCASKNSAPVADRSVVVAEPQIGENVESIAPDTWYVYQASNNDYWFGTNEHGVFRYDGSTLTQYTTKQGLAENQVRGIEEDKFGNVFVSSGKHVNRFDGKVFTTLTPVAEVSPLTDWKLQRDDLWFAGAQDSGTVLRWDGTSLYRLKFPETKRGNEELKRFPRDKFPNAIYNPYDVYKIYRDSKGHVWFGTATLGTCRFDGTSFDWLYEDHLTTTQNGGSFGIRSIVEDADRTFWICNTQYKFQLKDDATKEVGRHDGVVQYTRSPGIEKLPFRVPEKYLYFMGVVKGSDDALWMVTYGNGVLRYDGKQTTHYPLQDGNKDITAFAIYKDRGGNLWIGTHENGPLKFNGKTFEKFQPMQKK